MLIIDNKKDYYDYLSGIYGIDRNIVYDRRCSVMINPNRIHLNYPHEQLFAQEYSLDKPRTLKRYYSLPEWHSKENHKWSHQVLSGDYYYFLLESGYRHYFFEIERYIDDKGRHVAIPQLIKQSEGEKYVSDVPVAIIDLGIYTYRLDYKPTQKKRMKFC